MDNFSQFKELFLREARQHLSILQKLLESMDQDGNQETIEQLHLHAHSLKGEAFVMQFKQFGTYATVVEKYIKSFKDSKTLYPKDKNIILKSALNEMNNIVNEIERNQTEPADIPEKIITLQQQLDIHIL